MRESMQSIISRIEDLLTKPNDAGEAIGADQRHQALVMLMLDRDAAAHRVHMLDRIISKFDSQQHTAPDKDLAEAEEAVQTIEAVSPCKAATKNQVRRLLEWSGSKVTKAINGLLAAKRIAKVEVEIRSGRRGRTAQQGEGYVVVSPPETTPES